MQPLRYKMCKMIGTHKFLCMPNAPKSLLQRDLLEKLEAEIKFKNGEIQIRDDQLIEMLSLALIQPQVTKQVPLDILDQAYPGAWADGILGKAKHAKPIQVRLKPGAQPVRIKQYPLKLEDRKEIKPVIDSFLKSGLLVECESEYNTPILPVQKLDGKSYRLVQDLRAINKIIEDLYPVVANPYALLTKLRENLVWFTVLDLKDAFFCLPLEPERQK